MDLKEIFSTQIVVHVLFILVYFPIRENFLNKASLTVITQFNLSFELIIFFSSLLLFTVKMKQYQTQEFILTQMFFISKVSICLMIFFGDNKTVLAYYSLAWFFSWLMLEPIKYRGKHRFTEVDEKTLELTLKYHKENSGEIGTKYVFLQCFAHFSEHCYQTERIWAYFSNQYANENMVFLKVQIDKFPKLASTLQINISGFSRQLPTVIMFKEGEELRRFPEFDESGKVGKVLKYEVLPLEKYFQFKEIILNLYLEEKKCPNK